MAYTWRSEDNLWGLVLSSYLWVWGLDSDHRASQQSPLPAEPSRRLPVHTPLLAPGSSRVSSSHPFFCTWLRVCRACKRSHVGLALRIQVENTLEGEQLFPLCRRGDWDGRRIHLQTDTVDGIGSLTHILCFSRCPKVKKIGGRGVYGSVWRVTGGSGSCGVLMHVSPGRTGPSFDGPVDSILSSMWM